MICRSFGLILLAIALASPPVRAADDVLSWGVGYDGGIMSFFKPGAWDDPLVVPSFYYGMTLRLLSRSGWEVVLAGNPYWYHSDHLENEDDGLIVGEWNTADAVRSGWVRLTAGRRLLPGRRVDCAVDLGAAYRWSRRDSRGESVWYDGSPATFDKHSSVDTWSVFAGLRPVLEMTNRLSLEFGFWMAWIREHTRYISQVDDAVSQVVYDGYSRERTNSGWSRSPSLSAWRISAVLWF